MTKKIYTKEYLESLGLVDTTPRPMDKKEVVKILCACKKEGECGFYNAANRLSIKGYGFKCKECLSKENSARASLKTGDKNPFYGKHHTPQTIERIKETRPAASKKARQHHLEKYGVDHPAHLASQKNKTAQTCSEKYGAGSYLASETGKKAHEAGVKAAQDETARQKRTATIVDKYGVNHYSKTEEFKEKLKKSRTYEHRYVLSDGRFLVDVAQQCGKNPSNAIRVFKRYGEEAMLKYLSDQTHASNSLETMVLGLGIPNLERYNKKPCQFVPYRPDFTSNGVFVNCDGLYWHSEFNQENDYHFVMRKVFENAGLKLLQFREDEIVYKPHVVKSIIENAVGFTQKLDARKCSVVHVTASDSKEFFINNHLMGNRHAKAYGLVFRGKLVCCLSVIKKPDGFEIARFANLIGHTCRGGFSRLLSHITLDYKPTRIISYCDLRYATGASYERNGFKLLSTTIGWCWTDGTHTYNRLQCRANMDERRLTMEQHASELGWYKIYDAGQARYEKTFVHQVQSKTT